MKKKRVIDAGALHYANLAIFAESDGDYEDASKHWHSASQASSEPDSILLYEQAAVRCERRAKERMGKPDKKRA